MPTYVKQWLLGTVVVGVASVSFALWREQSTDRWRDWNERRALLIEIRYRLSRCIESHVPIGEARNLCDENLLEGLDNADEGNRRFVVLELKDRSFDSLVWDLADRYRDDSGANDTLDGFYFGLSLMARQGASADDLASAVESLAPLWRELLEEEPAWWWVPIRKDL